MDDADPYAALERTILGLSDSLKMELQMRPDRLSEAGGRGATMGEFARASTHDLRSIIGLTDVILSQQQQINDLRQIVRELR